MNKISKSTEQLIRKLLAPNPQKRMSWTELFKYNIGFPIQNYSYAELVLSDENKLKKAEKAKEDEHPFKRIPKRSNTFNYQQQGLLQQKSKPTQDIVNEIKQKYTD